MLMELDLDGFLSCDGYHMVFIIHLHYALWLLIRGYGDVIAVVF